MSPSLSLAFRQIQIPSWWYEGNRPVSAETKRKEILAYLKLRNEPVCGIEMRDKFNMSTSYFWEVMKPLIESGKVIKHKPRHDRTLLEAA